MIIIAGAIYVDPSEQGSYLAGCRAVVTAAREAEGCLDFHLATDPLEPGRINVFERWASAAAVEAFRGDGPPDDQQAQILDARVVQYEVTGETPL
jgi:quinol monooxygenase YgiN